MEESFIVRSFVVSEKKRGAKNAPPMPKYRKTTPCEIGLTIPHNSKPVMEEEELNLDDKEFDIWQPIVGPYCSPVSMVKMNSQLATHTMSATCATHNSYNKCNSQIRLTRNSQLQL